MAAYFECPEFVPPGQRGPLPAGAVELNTVLPRIELDFVGYHEDMGLSQTGP